MKIVMVIAVVIAEFFAHFYSSQFDLGMRDFKIEKIPKTQWISGFWRRSRDLNPGAPSQSLLP